jgi:Cu/Zn superoxide dismutase
MSVEGEDSTRILNLLFTTTLSCSLTALVMGDETSKSAHANILNAEGIRIGTADITPTSGRVKIAVNVAKLPPEERGVHIHDVGCLETSQSLGPDS